MTNTQELFPLGHSDGITGGPQDSRRFDPVSAVTGGLGVVGNLVGGIMGNSAAKKAGELQNQAAIAAGQKVEGAAVDANKVIVGGAANASDMALRSGQHVEDTAATGAADVNAATGKANDLLNPYNTTGTTATNEMNSGLVKGGDFNKTPGMSDLQMDPGYAWRLEQGQQAMERSAAAKGGLVSGSALKDLTNYSQGAASQEYQNAFNRFETSTQNRFANLSDAARQGQAAGTTMSNNLTGASKFNADLLSGAATTNLGANEFAGGTTYDAARTAGANTIGGARSAADYLTGGAAARAAGIVGGSNALRGGIGGAINSGFQGVQNSQMQNYLKNPALRGSFSPVGPSNPNGSW